MDDQTKDQLIRISQYFEAELSFGGYTDDQKINLGNIASMIDQLIDSDKNSHNRFLLRQRINNMVKKITEESETFILQRDIHTAWMKDGGKSQTQSTVEELQDKVDWLYENWPEVFKRDTRTWVPKSKRNQSLDPVLSRVEVRGQDEHLDDEIGSS